MSNNVIGGSKPIRSNVTIMPTTSFLPVLCHHKFVSQS